MLTESQVTLGIGTVGNIEALCLCLSGVLNGRSVPAKIIIRSEGPFPGLNNFCLEQLAELARLKGVEFNVAVIKSQGARKGCDWTLDRCSTPYLWMLDDDVVPEYTALEELMLAVQEAGDVYPWGFICGNKRDLNNRRNYGDFSQKELSAGKNVEDYCSTNLYYSYGTGPRIVKCAALDTGHVLLRMEGIRKHKLRFAYFEQDYNCGGYDTFFGLQCLKADLPGYFCHHSKAWHLEKQTQNFGEWMQRKAYLLRAAELLGFSDGALEQRIFNWVK